MTVLTCCFFFLFSLIVFLVKSSDDFEEFLNFLGTRIQLKGWKQYRAGLDVKSGTTGIHSVYTKFSKYEIMFHVSTLLPAMSNNKQNLERKRHLGNNIVVIIFKEGDTPIPANFLKSEVNRTKKKKISLLFCFGNLFWLWFFFQLFYNQKSSLLWKNWRIQKHPVYFIVFPLPEKKEFQILSLIYQNLQYFKAGNTLDTIFSQKVRCERKYLIPDLSHLSIFFFTIFIFTIFIFKISFLLVDFICLWHFFIFTIFIFFNILVYFVAFFHFSLIISFDFTFSDQFWAICVWSSDFQTKTGKDQIDITQRYRQYFSLRQVETNCWWMGTHPIVFSNINLYLEAL